MANELRQQLQAIDLAVLTEVVRKDQRDPTLSILDWTVEPLKQNNLGLSNGGLFRFSGRGSGTKGVQPWMVVLKCISLPNEDADQQREWTYLRREILAFKSGLLEQLPPGLRAPRYYGVMEHEHETWVWLEHIQESTGKQWPLERFQQTARRLGRFNAAYLCGTPLPDDPWLCRQPVVRSIWREHGWWVDFLKPGPAENAWALPFIQRGFDAQTKSRVLQLLADKEHFFAANDRLPQVLCHNDAHRRNFMWTQSADTGEEELIAIDWSLIGLGALGNDLGKIIENSMLLLDYDPFDAETLAAAGFEGYLAGIADAGVVIDPRLVKLGHLISLSFWVGAAAPGWAAIMLAPDSGIDIQAMYGHSPGEALAGWVHLNRYCLDRADEARSLIRELGL